MKKIIKEVKAMLLFQDGYWGYSLGAWITIILGDIFIYSTLILI